MITADSGLTPRPHCKLKRPVSTPKCQMSSTAPRANSAHYGAILNIFVSIQPSLEVSAAHRGSQFTPECISAPGIRTVIVL